MRVGVWLTLLALACDPPKKIKTSSGEAIEAITIEERFARGEGGTKETNLYGDRLRGAVELMDRHGVIGLNATYESKAVLDSGSVTIIVQPVSGAERRIVVKNCSEEKVCKFFDEAVGRRVVAHKPLPCRGGNACDKR